MKLNVNEFINKSKALFGRFVLDNYGLQILKRKAPSYELVFPMNVSELNSVPNHIIPPPYAFGESEDVPEDIIFKTDIDLKFMRQSCSLAKRMLNAAGKYIKVGMTTDELDKHMHKLIINNMAYPSPLKYSGYPKSICTSVNNVACHGIPDNRPLANGDIISVDVTVYYQGYHGDCAATFLVGDVDEAGQKLVASAERILHAAISKCKPGEPLIVIADTVTQTAHNLGLSVIPSICGHGVGQYFHEAPSILHEVHPNMADEYSDERMEQGMTFTIEPVIGEGEQNVVLLEDGWTLVTEDDSRTAQFEHTILITKNGAEILTK